MDITLRTMTILESIVTAVCLCADCFSVALCSSVTLKEKPGAGQLSKISLSFAVIQSGLLLVGWLCGSLLAGIAGKIAHIIGGLLLVYVGASMLIEAIKNNEEAKDLNGWRNIIVGGIATSIDALAVGGARSLEGGDRAGMLSLFISVFIVTLVSVLAGILSGNALGRSFGRWAEITGGTVLLGMGVAMMVL